MSRILAKEIARIHQDDFEWVSFLRGFVFEILGGCEGQRRGKERTENTKAKV